MSQTAIIKAIRNVVTGLVVEINNRKPEEVLAEIVAQGGAIGLTSLRYVMKGQRAMACGFELFEKQPPVNEVSTPAPETKAAEPETEEPKAAEPEKEAAVEPETEEPAAIDPRSPWGQLMNRVTSSNVNLVPDAAKPHVVEGRVTVSSKGKIFDTNGKPMVKPVRRGSKVDLLMQALMAPEGVSSKELQVMFNWTDGGVSSYLHYEPQAKGYFVENKMGADGKRRYFLVFPEGVTGILYA